jgi:hypothetical protein
MLYKVKRISEPPADASLWNTSPWQDIPSGLLGHCMGSPPAHFPKTEIKMAYDGAFVYLIFRVEDRYVRAIARRHQQSVCGDSCVEFFFTPGPDEGRGYFNLEINCGGTVLFHFHPRSDRGTFTEMPLASCNRLQCRHSLPQIVDPEMQEEVIWTVSVRIPFDVLREYTRAITPAPGEVWRGNFYKCADATSHPHWLTWAPVDAPKPDFHLPRFFGTLAFV